MQTTAVTVQVQDSPHGSPKETPNDTRAPEPPRGRSHLVLLLVILGIVIVFPMYYHSTSVAPATAESTPVDTATAPPPEKLGWLTARQLSSFYHQGNEVRADQAQKGARIGVKGTVHAITKDVFDKIWVEIIGLDDTFNNVHANFADSYTAQVSELYPGDRIIISCHVQGLMMEAVMLRDCWFTDESKLGENLLNTPRVTQPTPPNDSGSANISSSDTASVSIDTSQRDQIWQTIQAWAHSIEIADLDQFRTFYADQLEQYYGSDSGLVQGDLTRLLASNCG